jgi:tRNA(Met) cytidine acetyltransferase
VVDLTESFDPDLVAMAPGFVRAGGALVLVIGDRPVGEPDRERYAAHPFGADDVGRRFASRFENISLEHAAPVTKPQPVAPDAFGPSAEQDRLVAEIGRSLNTSNSVGAAWVIAANRGRGKSVALARIADSSAATDVVCTAANPHAAGEITARCPTIPFISVTDLIAGGLSPNLVLVDEAATLPVPALKKLVHALPQATFLFATTTSGYEGTGRGFGLRFVPWLRQLRPTHVRELEEPIRWSAGDRLEAWAFDALLLDAALPPAPDCNASKLEHRVLDRDELVANEVDLRQFFGLLVQAHYRTTPGDFRRMLDAPNVDLHGLWSSDTLVAASMVAREGKLTATMCDDLYHGRSRIVGHALPEVLVSHMGFGDAGELDIVRSVRIAVHPEARRRGIGTRLIDAVHATYSPDVFATLFGATHALLDFREKSGYRIVRLAASRGSRAGVPAVAMVRPVSPTAHGHVEAWRQAWSATAPDQLGLMQVDGELPLEDGLADRLLRDARSHQGAPAELARDTIAHYATGPRTLESSVWALRSWLNERQDALRGLPPSERACIEARVFERRTWHQTAEHAGVVSVRAAMRAVRRGVETIFRDERDEQDEHNELE